jgi:hypothetical protein
MIQPGAMTVLVTQENLQARIKPSHEETDGAMCGGISHYRSKTVTAGKE